MLRQLKNQNVPKECDEIKKREIVKQEVYQSVMLRQLKNQNAPKERDEIKKREIVKQGALPLKNPMMQGVCLFSLNVL